MKHVFFSILNPYLTVRMILVKNEMTKFIFLTAGIGNVPIDSDLEPASLIFNHIDIGSIPIQPACGGQSWAG